MGSKTSKNPESVAREIKLKNRRKPLCGLAQRKKFSFMNWTLYNAIHLSRMGTN